jgi:hypothetical protein
MNTHKKAILDLPGDEEIASTREARRPDNANLIKKTIRYQSGMVAVLIKDSQENIYSVYLRCSREPFRLAKNRILRKN